MNSRRLELICLALGLAVVAILGWWWLQPEGAAPVAKKSVENSAARRPADAERFRVREREPRRGLRAEASAVEDWQALLDAPDARQGEALFVFRDAAALARFLDRARLAGLKVLARIDPLHAVRVHYDSPAQLALARGERGDEAEIAANYLVFPPAVPPAEERAASGQIPLGNGLRRFLGVTEDASTWGRGVTIAVLDTGVLSDPTFGGRLRSASLGPEPAASDAALGHGTAVAALAAGADPSAPGVAPAADVLSIRVTDAEGVSDVFTVAQAIVAAVDQGADVINISLGGYHTATVLEQAIGYATERGRVIVAAAGNDQAAQLTWPAADPRVVSVAAVDATGQQVMFSNAGPQLQIAAPGLGLQTAWTGGERVLFDGTSASAPVVSGAIAALMSQRPGRTAPQAWEVLRDHASDGGPAGADPDYGYGVVNLGWAMAAEDPQRVDTAVSSHHLDPAGTALDVVVQNRSARGLGGLTLVVRVDGAALSFSFSWLAAGASGVARVPLDASALAAGPALAVDTELVNPAGVSDAVPANNHRRSLVGPPGIEEGPTADPERPPAP